MVNSVKPKSGDYSMTKFVSGLFNSICAAALIVIVSTGFAFSANESCEKNSWIAGASGAVVSTVGITVAAIASAPIVGTGIAAGSTVGVVRALSGNILRRTTLPAMAIWSPFLGAFGYLVGVTSYCVTTDIGDM